jgi:hypothetical protein
VDLSGSIDLSFLVYSAGGSASLDSSSDVLSVTEGAFSYSQQLAGTYTADEYFKAVQDSGSGTLLTLDTTPCYVLGTRLMTERGEVAVEDLHIGDRLITLDGTARPIGWIGHRQLDLMRHAAPELAQPIRIRADAIADGMPRRDLLVSPDHGVLLDDGLIAARLLVNGASIEREAHCRAVTYYHVELETHDIVLAEALPAESYLDTGNRGMFENADAPLLLHPDFCPGQQQRVGGSCRRFIGDAASLEPIWRRLAVRAGMLGLRLLAEVATTDDPALHVVVGGRAIKPVSVADGRYTFVLPTVSGLVRLVSRAARPCDVRPWVEDQRRLGVMVARLTLRRGAEIEAIPLDHPHLSRGWWDAERDGATLWRWTDGNAAIGLSADGSAGFGPVVLDIVLAGGLDYPLGHELETAASRAGDGPCSRALAPTVAPARSVAA